MSIPLICQGYFSLDVKPKIEKMLMAIKGKGKIKDVYSRVSG